MGISANKKFTQSELREIFDVCSRKDLTGDWNKIRDILNTRLKKDYNESTYRKKYQSYCDMKSACKDIDPDFTGDTTEVGVQKRELEKERKKLQTEKLEYNRWLRENAREEMIYEQINDGINKLIPLEIPEPRAIKEQNREAVLCLADAHFNTEFETLHS